LAPRQNGTGSTSLYGRTFPDEAGALAIPFDRPGLLAMANRGANTNGSQWFVTVAATPFLDGKYAVFGELSEGLATAVELADTLEVDFTSRPKRGLVVADAGLL
jgi:peptidyl-prolyl isomerase D